MEEYQKRVVEEKAKLDEKLAKLQEFLFSAASANLDLSEQWRLTTQCHIMTEYSAILAARIAAF